MRALTLDSAPVEPLAGDETPWKVGGWCCSGMCSPESRGSRVGEAGVEPLSGTRCLYPNKKLSFSTSQAPDLSHSNDRSLGGVDEDIWEYMFYGT